MRDLFIVRRSLNLPNRLHQRVLHGDADITTGIILADFSEMTVIRLGEAARSVANSELEHLHAGVDVGQADMDAALEAAADGSVELPGDIGSAQDEHAARILADAIHLHQQLRLDAPRGFRLAFAAWAAECVDFVDEDDCRLVFAGHVEELFDESVQLVPNYDV